jgi:PKD repeat protein
MISATSNNTIKWTSQGTGSFSNETDKNPMYYPSVADRQAGSVTLSVQTTSCSPGASDEMKIVFPPEPVVNAGSDQKIGCTDTIKLQGTAMNASGVYWRSTGTGSFFPDSSDLNAIYILSSADKSRQIIRLYLTAQGSICYPVSDSVLIENTPAPYVNVGDDQAVCKNATAIPLYGKATNATSATWSTSGTGTFSPSASDLSADYIPSEADRNQNIVLTLTTAPGLCPPVSKSFTLTFRAAAAVDAGPDQFVCSGDGVLLKGSANTEVIWSTTGTGYFSNIYDPSSYYRFSFQDKAIGMVTFKLTSRVCDSSLTDEVIVKFPAVEGMAAPVYLSCMNDDTLMLNGTTANVSNSQWATNGSGTLIQSPGNTNAKYIATAEDRKRNLWFVLSVSSSEACGTISDTVYAELKDQASASAITTYQTCERGNIALNAKIFNATGGIWSTTGTGTFYPDSTSLTGTYIPSENDYQKGFRIQLTTTGNKYCWQAGDSRDINFYSKSTVDAGENAQLDSEGVQLNGKVTGTWYYKWKSGGSGKFTPNDTVLNAKYIPSAADLAKGTVKLYLSTPYASCPETDSLVLSVNVVACKTTIRAIATGNKINFEAENTNTEDIGAYQWNFGDNTTASGKTAEHIYSNAGNYPVTLTFSTSNGSCLAEADTSITIWNVPVQTYSLSGTVKADTGFADRALISVFKLKNDLYELAKTSETENNGKYQFDNLENGTYILFAIPVSLSDSSANYLPTYYGGKTNWEEASKIYINDSNLSGMNISLQKIPAVKPIPSGQDNIEGTVTFESGSSQRIMSGSVLPVEKAAVYLYNGTKLIKTTTTSEYGFYRFDNVAAGSYTIQIEYPGAYQLSETLSVTTDGNASTVSVLDASVLRQTIVTGLNSNLEISSTISVYPNPAKDYLYAEIPADMGEVFKISVFNISGAVVFEKNYQQQSPIKIDTDNLENGFYFMKVSNSRHKWQTKFIKY